MKDQSRILNLTDPNKNNSPLDCSGYEFNFLLHMLERMILIRLSEERLARERQSGVIGGPVHLSAGQEAIAVGVSQNLNNQDKVFGAHRSHSHLLALNPDVHKLFAEVLGKDTGFSRGMGGSMHLVDEESGFYGSVPIVSGTVPLAVGAAFQSKRSNTDNVGVAYIGDGAMEEGVVHESLNLASILPCPTIFIVENNLFSSHMHISLRQPENSTTRFADANNIKNELIDGNNVLEVYEISKEIIAESIINGIPGFIEAITYRHYGHVDWRKDIDVGVNRSIEDVEAWLERDPIKRLFLGMKESSLLTEKDLEEIQNKTLNYLDLSWDQALKDPYPKEDELIKRVYSND